MKRYIFLSFALFAFAIFSCSNAGNKGPAVVVQASVPDSVLQNMDTATLAGGCFWCTEAAFERIKGVATVVSGYSGGKEKDPTYQQVSSGLTSHAEAVQVYYDPEVISFRELLEIFFTAHDPTQLNRQGPDVGKHYRSAIFYHDSEQKKIAEEFMAEQSRQNIFNDPIVTELSPYTHFYIAEGYHQDYYINNPNDRYINNVSKPKVEKVEKKFEDRLKEEYK